MTGSVDGSGRALIRIRLKNPTDPTEAELDAWIDTGFTGEGLLSQTLIIHLIRTAKVPFFQSTASSPLLFLTLTVMIVGIVVPFSPVGETVGLVPLPWSFFPWLVATLVSYFVLMQLAKSWYIRRFGIWL
jgi:Mg2+-importing ATPase